MYYNVLQQLTTAIATGFEFGSLCLIGAMFAQFCLNRPKTPKKVQIEPEITLEDPELDALVEEFFAQPTLTPEELISITLPELQVDIAKQRAAITPIKKKEKRRSLKKVKQKSA